MNDDERSLLIYCVPMILICVCILVCIAHMDIDGELKAQKFKIIEQLKGEDVCLKKLGY
ncbi:MAG: hypothetical protein ACYC6W_10980 [Nitrosotalea sp.]